MAAMVNGLKLQAYSLVPNRVLELFSVRNAFMLFAWFFSIVVFAMPRMGIQPIMSDVILFSLPFVPATVAFFEGKNPHIHDYTVCVSAVLPWVFRGIVLYGFQADSAALTSWAFAFHIGALLLAARAANASRDAKTSRSNNKS